MMRFTSDFRDFVHAEINVIKITMIINNNSDRNNDYNLNHNINNSNNNVIDVRYQYEANFDKFFKVHNEKSKNL